MLKKILTLTVITGLVLAAVLISENPKITAPLKLESKPQTPIAIIKNSITRQYNPQGQLEYLLQVETAEQFLRVNPKNDKPLSAGKGYTELSQPDLTLFQSEQTPWNITAENGRAENNGTVITLWGDVVVYRSLADGGEYIMSTDQLEVRPLEQLAETDRAVTIRSPNGVANAVGMRLNMINNVTELLSQVKGVYESNPLP